MNVIKPLYVTGYSTFARSSTGTYFDKNKVMQTAANDVQRINWNPETGVFEGVLIEPERTNLLLNSASPAYQTRNVTKGKTYTLSFYGTGAITLTGAVGATLSGGGTPSGRRTVLTFTAGATTLTLDPFGTVTNAQLEEGAYPTSYIPTTSAPATRAADIVGPAGMFQTSFPQPHPQYSAATTYNTGQVVALLTRLYESLVDSNLGNTPATSPTKWVDIGPTNQFACVDQKVSIPSIGPGPLHTTALKLPGPANVVGLVGVQGTKVHVAFNDQAGNIYTNSSSTINSAVVLVAHPGGSIVSVCVENTAGDVVLGELVAGEAHTLGGTQYGHSFSITDYSRKDTDEFGTTTFVERPFAKRMSASVLVPKASYNRVIALLESIRAKPTVWIASDDPEYSAGAIVYGNWADFDLEIAYPTENLCNLEIQGLI